MYTLILGGYQYMHRKKMGCVSKSTGMPALTGVPFFKQPPNYGGKKKNTGNIPANYTKKMGTMSLCIACLLCARRVEYTPTSAPHLLWALKLEDFEVFIDKILSLFASICLIIR
jgi:hypothetical protein